MNRQNPIQNLSKTPYPFGMQMPGRSFSSGSYRYGFNSQEQDNEIYGNGNSYTAEFWQYDPRLGRRWNVDPVIDFSTSPYHVMHLNPINKTDPNGDCDECAKKLEKDRKKHTVEKGESPSSISKQYEDVTMTDIAAWNPEQFPEFPKNGSMEEQTEYLEGNNWSIEPGDKIYISSPVTLGQVYNEHQPTFDEFFKNLWEMPVGSITSDGEIILGKYDEKAVLMMLVAESILPWGTRFGMGDNSMKLFSIVMENYLKKSKNDEEKTE
jgi:RHS repeat-associated protein